MGSSKRISDREVTVLILLLQQGGLFWLLPYLLLSGNGTAGLFGLLPGLLLGLIILAVCVFWGKSCNGRGFVQSLMVLLGKPAGFVTGALFVALYLAFTVICLSCFAEVISNQLLPDTPRLLLLVPVLVLVGWLAWDGLEDIARLMVLCALLAVLLLLLALAGSAGNFAVENLLPLSIRKPEQLQMAAMHSMFSYSSFLILFMVYPALHQKKDMGWRFAIAMTISAIVFVLWVGLALGVFGQFSTGSLIWLPLELARMIQIGSFLERTEALFTVIWLPLVLVNASLLLWGASAGAHQLFGRQKNRWLHWGITLLALVLCAGMRNFIQLLRAEQMLAMAAIGLVPILLLLVLTGTLLHRRRKEEPQP